MPVPCFRPVVAAADICFAPQRSAGPLLPAPARARVTERPGRPGGRLLLALATFLCALVLAGCGKSADKEEVVRPVRIMQLQSATGQTVYEYSGDIRPRIESRLGFRVTGKIAARLVDVGATVRQGQPLARLDPADLALAEAGSRAQVDSARTDRDLAAADLKRYKELFAKGFISAAEQHRRQATFDAAESRVRQAEASLRNQANQTGYAVLQANADGVVTAIDAEVGQVVSPGQSVIRVAQTAEMEVAIGLPEDQVERLRGVRDVMVRTWSAPARSFPGRVREISPAADPVTRTYAARISIPAPPPDLKFGMTAAVTFVRDGEGASIRVPLTALLQVDGRNQVWVFERAGEGNAASAAMAGADPGAGTVRLVDVRLGAPLGNDVIVTSGLTPGQRVVTAGVHLLKAGQRVRPMQSVAPASAPQG